MHYRIRRRNVTIAAVAALMGAGTFLVGPASASESPPEAGEPIRVMGSCGESYNPEIAFAKAHWDLTCSNGKITVDGRVQATWPWDGKCNRVKAKFAAGNTERSGEVCSPGERTSFRWSHPGAIADVYLYEY